MGKNNGNPNERCCLKNCKMITMEMGMEHLSNLPDCIPDAPSFVHLDLQEEMSFIEKVYARQMTHKDQSQKLTMSLYVR